MAQTLRQSFLSDKESCLSEYTVSMACLPGRPSSQSSAVNKTSGTAPLCSAYPGQMEGLGTAPTISADPGHKAAGTALRCSLHPGQMEGLETAPTIPADCAQGGLGAECFQVQICQKGILAHQSSCHSRTVSMASPAVTSADEINVSLGELYVGCSVSY